MGGNIAVFEDMAWQHLAHKTSGVRAMEFLRKRSDISFDTLQQWQAIGDILDVKPEAEVQAASQAFADQEQRVILQPYFGQLKAMTLAGVDVSFILSILAKAPNGTADFTAVVPGGNICNFSDRWSWVTDPSQGMWPAWCQMPHNDRHNFVIFNLMPRAAGFSRLNNVLLGTYLLTPDAVFPPQ
jgi:hypothetical protein